MRSTLYTFLVVGIILLCAGAYYFHRTAQANKLSHIESLAATRNVPATVCEFTEGDFEGARGGLLYVRNARIVLHTMYVEGNYAGRLHVLIEPDSTYFIDPATMDTIPIGLSAEEQITLINDEILRPTWKCSPWWFPDDSIFDIPKPAPEEE
ncbi:hypothetical protein A2763_02510 [Candidatus Kaiserbacteria bacterium RIFCSPHIGHO2_01_FULL_54_36]|uniref:Uncharacterized protein n=1 Tax=Candidatus Kaiserbacteria bacterium RIFCSPHIGHO2_01_FULL_54_36 TaxID=1798482 RepID=A0A1F6CNM4_9BACT|nr:MAG: hypothetical protein A2763_02510 [Candidatus Kaiserbacteria bacterium RIFCSPHIGHO2_01_FULL_54_36]OGG75504.1 MAG: hypothetical protein A3A41_00360 [Candidatus Kaiserbacteria bacterium RIFCSPLOWO2_01_FULL_54_22]